MKITGTIKIEKQEVDVNEGTSQKTGRAFKIRTQEAIAQLGREVRVIRLSLANDQAPYPVGIYDVSGDLECGRYGDLELPRYLSLQPTAKGKAA